MDAAGRSGLGLSRRNGPVAPGVDRCADGSGGMHTMHGVMGACESRAEGDAAAMHVCK